MGLQTYSQEHTLNQKFP